jgi:hypothetical protein
MGSPHSKAQALRSISGALMKLKAPFVLLGQRMSEREPPLETVTQ